MKHHTAAYFVQEVVKGYESAYGNVANQQQNASDGDAVIVGKDAQNLLVCITELYNFEVVSCVLIYDIVRSLLKRSMGELEVELLLKILRSQSFFSYKF
jgi:nucleolar MIF4G domain-containing protein 1